jgi:L-ascorbate metabolism protein UlaG (beta-lactamase superfamily)
VKRWIPPAEHRPVSTVPAGDSLRLRWLGTAGHVIEAAGATLLVDPFLTRPSLLKTAALPLRPTPDQWMGWLPPSVDAILVGHSHYDHLMDAPAIALCTGARIVGSRTTACFARAAGVPPGQIHEVPPEGGAVDVGPLHVRFLPSRHGRIALGRVPLDGEVHDPPRLPARLWHYRMGGAYGILVEAPGRSIYHNGSADLVDAALEGAHADVVLAGLAGRQATPRYLDRLLDALTPQVVLPTHHDYFFRPLEGGPRLLPGIDLGAFVRDVRRLRPAARILMPTYEDTVHLPVDGSPAEGAVITPG